MNTRDELLAGIVADPLEETRWLVLADWLEENDDPRRAELLRLHRKLLATCCEPDAHPERAEWQRRAVELLGAGVEPCVPQHTLELPAECPWSARSSRRSRSGWVERATIARSRFIACLLRGASSWVFTRSPNYSGRR